jgi:hypothetical protein
MDRLTDTEYVTLRNRLIAGEKVSLAGLDFTDQVRLKPFVRKPKRVSLGADELDVIVQKLPERMHRAEGLQSPRDFLLKGPMHVIKPLLTPAELVVVERARSAQ